MTLLLVLLVGLVAVQPVSATVSGASREVDRGPNPEWVIVLDSSERPTTPDNLRVTIDRVNRTIAVEISDAHGGPLSILLREFEVRDIAPNPGFRNTSFRVVPYGGSSWFRVPVGGPVKGSSFRVQEFRPELGEASYTFGSPSSIFIGRPMFVSLSEAPRVEREAIRLSNGNGTWMEERATLVPRLGINFTDADARGQTVRLSRAWLGSYGLTEPFFRDANGQSIRNHTDADYAYLEPDHFSILYVFGTTNEGFTAEDLGTYSDVHWDSVNRNLYVKSDRRDFTGQDERLRSPSPFTYDHTSSFTVRATWKTSQQGNWQLAVPVFFMASGNDKVDMANSIYVLYQSRDSNLRQTPYYYLRYRDSGGTLRVNYQVPTATANAQYEFFLGYDAYTRVMTFAMYNNEGGHVGSTTYTVSTTQTFSLAKVGAAAWGQSSTNEPAIIAWTDNVLLDANAARNGNFESDSNGDGIPDNWQTWIWSDGPVYRSTDRSYSGSYSVKITDYNTANDYGLQTVRMSVLPYETYSGSAWVYVSSGSNSLCLEFWSAFSGGSRLGAVCKATTVTAQWEYLDVLLTAPTGAYWVDLLVYSSAWNTGTGYFDRAELRRSRDFWSMEFHNRGSVSDFATGFDYMRDLGITTVRTSLVWSEFEQDEGTYKPEVVDYWRSVVQLAERKGLRFVAILGGNPSWAENKYCYYDSDNGRMVCTDTFFAKWRAFARFVAGQYGSSIAYYQILNEENHPIYGSFFAHVHEGEPRAYMEAYQGLLEGTGLSTAAHKSRFKTVVNMYDGGDWNQYFRDILLDPWGGPSIDIVAIDHYPGTWCCYDPRNFRDWGVLDTLAFIARDFGKEIAVMETGFSTEGSPDHYQVDQEAFVNEAIDEVLARRNRNNLDNPLNAFLIVSWYELIDASTGCWICIPREANFGILLSSPLWGQKLAYDDLRYQVSRWA